MTWIVITVILIIAFGPVLWLVPSRKDRRLAALRTRARVEGLVVEMRRIPKLDPLPEERVTAGGQIKQPMIECASYGQPLRRSLRHLPSFRVLRRDAGVRGDADQSQPDPFRSWTYDQRPKGEGRRHLDSMLQLLEPVLDRLPSDVAAMEISTRMLLVYWLERGGSDEHAVSKLAAELRELDAALTRLEGQIDAELNTDDS